MHIIALKHFYIPYSKTYLEKLSHGNCFFFVHTTAVRASVRTKTITMLKYQYSPSFKNCKSLTNDDTK